MASKRVYLFKEGNKDMRMLLGGKGANLCEMTNLGLPVPPGFVISTSCCKEFFDNGSKELPPGLIAEYTRKLCQVEAQIGRKLGDKKNPLLLSVRSGAPASMPGMMDTVLNLGINDEIAAALIESTKNERWVYDCQRRFIQMFSNVVMGMDGDQFEEAITKLKAKRNIQLDVELTAADLKELTATFKKINPQVPEDPNMQLEMAIKAVFKSWFNTRAIRYRSYNNIPESWGTAVNVQCMVFGNLNTSSGTGVAFTRNPANGDPTFFGEFLEAAAGEDVVAGIRTPHPLADLEKMWPDVYKKLFDFQSMLEHHYRDMQDLEFTIENGTLFMLQCRNGKRTPKAAVKIAVDLYKEGIITKEEALSRIPANQMDFFLHSSVDPKANVKVIGTGLPASPGAATGEIVLTPDEAEEVANAGRNCILVRHETTPEDIHGMKAAVGILTKNGGMTSHAAVVARGMGTTCVCGVGALHIDMEKGTVTAGDVQLKRGDIITLDGVKGKVLLGDVPRVMAGEDEDFKTILQWADESRKLRVLCNADTPEDARNARNLGAEGIGLCRTEHMFFDPQRIAVMRAMILASTTEERQKELDKLFEYQRDDMLGLFRAMDGYPVTIRMLDPPLHEFLPKGEEALAAMAKQTGKTVEYIKRRVEELQEVNPMLGFRGCRLTIVYPEITAMQTRAIISAALEAKKQGIKVHPEIMIPVVNSKQELQFIYPVVGQAIQEMFAKYNDTVDYMLGTMIELPRACIEADKLASIPGMKFVSFGTNDLTQTTWGLSRDDWSIFYPHYVDRNVLDGGDPFQSLDEEGVGVLINMAMEKGRSVNPDLKAGICGEHGGDPKSIDFFHRAGLNYVSCSPFRVPIARIAAAQANIKQKVEEERKAHAALPKVDEFSTI